MTEEIECCRVDNLVYVDRDSAASCDGAVTEDAHNGRENFRRVSPVELGFDAGTQIGPHILYVYLTCVGNAISCSEVVEEIGRGGGAI